MKIAKFILFFLVLQSCKKESITLLIKNKGIYTYEKIPFDYENKTKVFTNKIELELTNTTNSNYLFLLREPFLNKVAGIKLRLFENGKLLNESFLNHNSSLNDESSKALNKELIDFENENKTISFLKSLGMKHDVPNKLEIAYYYQNEVIYNGGTYKGVYLLNLPILYNKDYDKYTMELFYSINKNKKYEIQFEYHLDSEKLYKLLSIKQKEYLEENEIEIYSQKVLSNKVPLIVKE